MASIQITFSLKDRPFANKLAADLESRGLEVTLDETLSPTPALGLGHPRHITVISRSSINLPTSSLTSDLPFLIDDIPLPQEVAGILYANFATSYELGLDQLLRTVWPASSRLLLESSGRQFACAYQGLGAGKIPPQMGFLAMAGEHWSFVAAIESVGDRILAPKLTRHLADMLATEFNKMGVPGRDCLEPLLLWANLFARTFRTDMKLPVDYPLGAKMAAMAQFGDQTLLGTVGLAGVFSKTMRNDKELIVTTFYSNSKFQVPNLDNINDVIALQAPLGYLHLDEDTKGWADCREFALASPQDLVAMATFRFPQEESRLTTVGRALAYAGDAVSSARLLTNTLAPAGRDAVCGVAFRKMAT